jgi:hypothetical protein
MIERFLLDWVDAKAAGAAIGREDNLILLARTYKTHPPLPFVELTKSWAEIALHPTILQPMPVLSGMIGRKNVHGCFFPSPTRIFNASILKWVQEKPTATFRTSRSGRMGGIARSRSLTDP